MVLKLTANTNIKQVDLPMWEWTRQAPVVSAAGASSCAAKNSLYHVNHGRFIYYLFATANFWRYDTVTDAWMQLSSVPNAVATWSSMVFRGDMGVSGRVLAGASSTVTLPTALSTGAYKDYDIEIIGGTGAGQRRIITSQAAAVIGDSGIATAVTALVITDSTKAWTINQWVGYTVRVVYGTGYSQQRRIIANDATSITFAALGKTENDVLAYPASPSPALVITAGSQAVYQIESTVCTVDTAWGTQPDATSRFEVRSGVVLLLSAIAGGYLLQQYSIAEDLWYTRSSPSSLGWTTPTDGSINGGDETHTLQWVGLASAGTTTTLTDSSANWETDEFVGKWLYIFSGTGEGQLRKISANTNTQLTWVSTGTAPTTTSRYRIYSLEAGTVTTGGSSTTITDSNQALTSNRFSLGYQVKILFGTGAGQTRRIVSNTGTVLTVDKAITTSTDSIYLIQPDASTVLISTALNSEILRSGLEHDCVFRGFERDFGVIAGATAQYGDFRPISIASGTGTSGTITITTTYPHGFRTGWTIIHRGDTGASAVANNISATITVTGATTYTYSAPGSTAAWTIAAQSTTVLRDASKAWTTNEHAGRICTVMGAFTANGQTPATMIQIASNTANSLTFVATTTAPVVGNRYVISDRTPIGSLDEGIATGTQSTTTLQDTGKAWVVNIWAGRRVKFLGGTGQGQELIITSNTSNTLTFATATAPVTAATSYSILTQPPRGVGIELVIPYNTSRTGGDIRYVYVPRGGATIGWDVIDITNNSMILVPLGQQFETLTTGSMYCYDGRDRIYFCKDATNRLYYLDVPTGVVYPAGQSPYVVGTAILGNRMDIVTTQDRLKFLYVNRHSNIEMFRSLLFF
jgi:hypothetical protein